MSAPIDTPPALVSLGDNRLCGLCIPERGRRCPDWGETLGTYTDEGIAKLCEGLKGSAVTSLKCTAPRPKRSLL